MSDQGNGGPGAGEPPKIIVDSDWKQQAQAEKEKLRRAEQERQAKQQAAGSPDDADARPIGFTDITRMLATQALMYLGAIADPETGKAMLAPDMARAYIDMLGILEEKTKGNLDEEESRELSMIANELRMNYVEVSKAIEKAIAEGKIKPGQFGGGAAPGGPGSPIIGG